LVLATGDQAGYMNFAAHEPTGRLRGFARRIFAVIAECNYAQRRMVELATAPDRYLFNPDVPPATYAEFLYRTSGVLRHEPTARARARARVFR
jgi:hypothetical protein